MQTFPTIRDADIIPEDYQMRLMAWRDEFTRGYFEIGDIANEIVLVNIQKGLKVEQALIYSAVGRFCGKSGRTVRDYAEVAAFFPEELRKNYDVLPFSHFRFAKTCGVKWEEVLEFSLLHPDASEERLAHEFTPGVAAGMSGVAAEDNISDISHADVAAGVAADNSTVAVAASADVAAWLPDIYILANLISQTERILSWKINPETRRKLLLGLDSLKDALCDLSKVEVDVGV